MTRLVNVLSRMLDPDEREAVCGDFEESGETGGRALRDLLGLVARRQAGLWKGWRPWLALVSLVIPLGIFLSQAVRQLAAGSAIYSWMYLNNWTMTYLENAGFRMELFGDAISFALQYLMLIFWSWTVGFVLGSLSRGAAWVTGSALCFLLFEELVTVHQGPYGDNAAAFAVGFYRLVLPVILQIALVLIPSLHGMYQGARMIALSPRQIALWAVALVILTTCTGLFGWRHFPIHRVIPIVLAWPIAYLIAATGWKRWHVA